MKLKVSLNDPFIGQIRYMARNWWYEWDGIEWKEYYENPNKS
jgi:hypothetical protein